MGDSARNRSRCVAYTKLQRVDERGDHPLDMLETGIWAMYAECAGDDCHGPRSDNVIDAFAPLLHTRGHVTRTKAAFNVSQTEQLSAGVVGFAHLVQMRQGEMPQNGFCGYRAPHHTLWATLVTLGFPKCNIRLRNIALLYLPACPLYRAHQARPSLFSMRKTAAAGSVLCRVVSVGWSSAT